MKAVQGHASGMFGRRRTQCAATRHNIDVNEAGRMGKIGVPPVRPGPALARSSSPSARVHVQYAVVSCWNGLRGCSYADDWKDRAQAPLIRLQNHHPRYQDYERGASARRRGIRHCCQERCDSKMATSSYPIAVACAEQPSTFSVRCQTRSVQPYHLLFLLPGIWPPWLVHRSLLAVLL